MGKISEFFTWKEVTDSAKAIEKGIQNILPPELVLVAEHTAKRMDIVRALLGNPVKVNSWYRCPELNVAVGSKSKRSQHMKAEAVDFVCPKFGSPQAIVRYLAQFKDRLDFDQLIFEHTWVHISFVYNEVGIPARENRNQVLTLLADGTYSQGITDRLGKELKSVTA